MDEVREDLIIQALEKMEQGQPVAAILQRYPQSAEALYPILEAATLLDAQRPAPTEAARQASRRQMLAAAQQLRQPRSRPAPRRLRIVFAAVSLALLLFLVAVVAGPAAADAIPGDLLYPLKRGVERVELLLAPATQRDALLEQIEHERNREVYTMLEVGRDGRAGYVGTLTAMDGPVWEIGRITARITDDTVIHGVPELGARVEAHCLVRDRQVVVESLLVLAPASSAP